MKARQRVKSRKLSRKPAGGTPGRVPRAEGEYRPERQNSATDP